MNDTVVIAFIPVVHKGVISFLEESKAKSVYLLAYDDVEGFDYLSREIRALSHEEIKKMLSVFGFDVFSFTDKKEFLRETTQSIIMPDEDISHVVAEKYFSQKKVIFNKTFLRWDWSKSTMPSGGLPEYDRVISKDDIGFEIARDAINKALDVSNKSSDFWRQVGAMLIPKNSTPILSYNKHMPNEYVPYIDGDPRQSFKPGEFNEIYTALHAEKGIISLAAKRGIALLDADLYVTTFPCNDCANQIVETGIKRIFFTGGYSNLNGAKTLRDHGVELIYVQF